MARGALCSTVPLAHNEGMNATTSNPAPASAYRDRKRWGWLLSVVGPGVAATGTLAHALGATSPWWFALPLVLFYLVVPLIDWLIGEDLTNPPESQVPALEADGYYRSILYAALPVLWGTVLFNLVFLATHPLPWFAWLATVLVTGSVLGFGLNLSHELGHKQDWLGRKLALFNTALGGYGHFSIEHNRGHHRHVSTPEDPASSRLGESIYRFVLREMPGAFRRAWALETDRLQLHRTLRPAAPALGRWPLRALRAAPLLEQQPPGVQPDRVSAATPLRPPLQTRPPLSPVANLWRR